MATKSQDAPRYRAARAFLDLTTGMGLVLILAGIFCAVAAFSTGLSVPLLASGAAAVICGFIVIAGAQLGYALIDTAVSSREMVDLLRDSVLDR